MFKNSNSKIVLIILEKNNRVFIKAEARNFKIVPLIMSRDLNEITNGARAMKGQVVQQGLRIESARHKIESLQLGC